MRLPYPITLTGDGITLREWRSQDLDDLIRLLDEENVARWTPMPSPFDVEAGLAYLTRAYHGRTSGQRIQLAITVDGGRPMGEVLLFGVDGGRHEAELGYLVGAPYRRRGLASGALSLLSGYARDSLGFTRLGSLHDGGFGRRLFGEGQRLRAVARRHDPDRPTRAVRQSRLPVL